MQLACKRKQQKWTQSYRDRVERLTHDGLMKPSGLKSVEKAKSNGNWFANVDVDDLVCPPDLHCSLQSKDAVSWWDKAVPSYKRNVLRWLASAKKEQTRQKRIVQIANACGAGLKIITDNQSTKLVSNLVYRKDRGSRFKRRGYWGRLSVRFGYRSGCGGR